ncbi:hypothetical protein [Dyella silvatica]|uniref:hypothetical protein n=1 Tax=Dyella silvatica TaxID=2992128 RepID=UPI00225512A4|nr:hypothetical protein [Dyella silvatica]
MQIGIIGAGQDASPLQAKRSTQGITSSSAIAVADSLASLVKPFGALSTAGT